MNSLCITYLKEVPLLQHDDGTNYLKCLIREYFIDIDSKPEEMVRQSALLFLLKMLPLKIYRISLEFQETDICIHYNIDSDFRPLMPPLLIIETKRKEVGIQFNQSVDEQIKNYMKKTRCNYGVIFNCIDIILWTNMSGFRKKLLEKMEDIVAILNIEMNRYKEIVDLDISLFANAKHGDLEEFKRLALKYNYDTFEIEFLSENGIRVENVFLLEFSRNSFSFNIRGYYSKKKYIVNNNNFIRLIAVTE